MKSIALRVAALALSMPLVTMSVKSQDPASTSDLKDSVKSDQSEISKLVATLMASGHDGKFVNGHAQAAGLDRPMPLKGIKVPIGKESRRCQVVYESDEAGGERPYCVYFLRTKKTSSDVEDRFYRVSLDGRLEKVVTLKNKIDDQGTALREGRSRVEEDLASPAVKKAFNAELTFWLKDWLKKQPKLDAKKATASAAAAQKTP